MHVNVANEFCDWVGFVYLALGVQEVVFRASAYMNHTQKRRDVFSFSFVRVPRARARDEQTFMGLPLGATCVLFALNLLGFESSPTPHPASSKDCHPQVQPDV